MTNQAIRPTNFNEFASVGKKEQTVEVDVFEEEQKALAYMGNLKGWQVLKEYIEDMVVQMDNIVTNGMNNGATFEELGRLTVVRQTAQDVIKRIIGRVEDSRKE